MGNAKNEQQRQDEDHDWAVQYLVSMGILEECEAHGDRFDGSGEVAAAYRKANSDISKGEIVLRKGQTRTDITDLLKSAYDDNSSVSNCPTCAKNMRD